MDDVVKYNFNAS